MKPIVVKMEDVSVVVGSSGLWFSRRVEGFSIKDFERLVRAFDRFHGNKKKKEIECMSKEVKE